MFLFGRKNFNLEKHLMEIADRYCDGLSEAEKEKILSRIICPEGNKGPRGKKIYRLDDLAPKNFPNQAKIDKMEKQGKLYPINSVMHQNAEKKVYELIKNLSGNNSQVSKDLKVLLAETKVTVRVRKWGRKNASVAFKKGKQNEIVLMVSEEMFKKTPYDNTLPGFLAHELGHTLDFSKRPKGSEKEFMDGVETTADIIGTRLALEAGYDSRAFGHFMGNDYRKTKKDYDFSPRGTFREDTMNIAHNEMAAIKAERNGLSSQKLRTMRGIEAPDKLKPSVKLNCRQPNLNITNVMLQTRQKTL